MKKLALSDEILLSVEKPSRYIGQEYNSYNKPFDPDLVRVAFCFPDVYDIATANLGMQIIYEQFNRRPDALCDRVYSPWVDLDRILREKGIPLFAVESQRPVKEFDFLLITLQYEMCYTNVLQVLDLSGIPLHALDRSETDPIVIGGGACAYNPEPMAEFFDVFYIGESETRYDEMVEVYREAKASGNDRTEILKKLANLEGLYVPRFYEAEYQENGTLSRFYRTEPDVPEKIRRQAADMRDRTLPYPLKPIVPFTRGMMDRATLEVMRGCIRGCRFCQAGMIYRPTRNRDLAFLKEAAVSMLESSGYDEINLSSLATSDYSEFAELLEFLIPYCEEHRINVGIPSLRIDSFSLDVMDKIQDVKKSSLTFAPEAGSQRLRNVINKGLTEEEILSGAAEAFKGGWNKVKLYFMLGQPFETDEDVKEIAVLSDKIARVYYETVPKEKRQGRVQISPSTSFFVPKPFTPFQWARMERPEEFRRKAYLVKDTLKEQLNQKSISYRYHDEIQTELEGLFARGDRRVSKVIEAAYRKGCIFDAWSEQMKEDAWEEALRETGISYEFYNYRERSTEEVLPWDFIDIGVHPSFLKREWENAKAGQVTPNCRETCSKCGCARYPGGVCHENSL
ncbi:MAG: TIGR03960 family B12-binding radical SAM protein [Lachnospiraceae bacterium]|nr:TIGR03960 family B12-binding radical SAM protein [Lachnospiraceae bacterium]